MKKHRYYILDTQHNLVGVNDVRLWAAFFEDDTKRRVATDTFEDGTIVVSTVFLGLDHSFDPDAPPVLFETMIFGGPHNEYQERYETWAQAVKGHVRAVKLVQGE